MRLKSNVHFDFRKRVAYDPEQKRLFHQTRVASSSSSPRRSASNPAITTCARNKGGLAVSGEITLHAGRLYVQASQPATGSPRVRPTGGPRTGVTGILFRSCQGRRDYVGGPNHFAPLDLLHEPAAPTTLIRRCIEP